MNRLTNKKDINRMVLLFTITYMVSYITRINYGAVISEMVKDTGISKALLSMALTGSFVTYGAGQIISGICGDKFQPKKLILYGFFVTILMNLIIPMCHSPYVMLGVWCVNGFAQAFMWPPMVRLMTAFFSDEEYKSASVKISWGSSLGTIIIYMVSPLIITLSGWRSVFFFSAACGIIMAFVWNKCCMNVETEKTVISNGEKVKGDLKPLFTPVMFGIMLAIILQGMLRDGVTTWMPSYIDETYNLGTAISILTGVVLPLFSIACFHISSALYRKKLKNPVLCAGVIFGAGAVSAVALYVLTGSNPVFSVFFSALLTGSMHGVNLMLICMIPPYFNKHGIVSTASGVLNSCTYIGSAISTYGIALVSEKMGWNFTLLTWLAIALLGTFVCFLCAKPWQKEKM